MQRGDIDRARRGEQAAFDRICERHAGLLWHFASRYFAPGLTTDDLTQEARIGLWKAVRDWKPPVPFGSFAALCVQRNVLTAVKAATRRKHDGLNGAEDIEAEGVELSIRHRDGWDDPARQVIARELLGDLLRALRWDLTRLEARALWLVEAEGLSYEAAAEELGASERAVDNALQRARRKLGVIAAQGGRCEVCDVEIDVGKWCRACEEEILFARQFV